jgi:hypothetical protein
MCFRIHELDRGNRRRLAIGNFSLAVGLLLWVFRAHYPVNQDRLQAVVDLLVGLSIGINLLVFGFARRCRASESETAPAPPQ